MNSPEPGTALETRPAVPMARTLAEAPVRSLVHVDHRGRVRSPARYKVLHGTLYVLMGGIMVGGLALYGSLLGLPGYALGALLCGWAGWSTGQGRRLEGALQLLVADRFQEAEAVLRDLLQRRFLPAAMRALAHQHLGVLYGRQGRFAEALVHQEEALRRHARRPKWIFTHALRCGMAITLTNLGRLDDAEAQLRALTRGMDGDYARLLQCTAEGYLALARGRTPWPEPALSDVTRWALGITGAAGLLGLCAWSWDRLGDGDQCALCLREAVDRAEGLHLPRSMPLLFTWMQARAGDRP